VTTKLQLINIIIIIIIIKQSHFTQITSVTIAIYASVINCVLLVLGTHYGNVALSFVTCGAFGDQLGGGGPVCLLSKAPFSGVSELGTDPVRTESGHEVT